MNLEKTFNPTSFETKWYQRWQKSGAFAPQGNGKPYCIMLPPPNVTGILHMGHAFQQTLMDLLIRYHRMKGDKTLWQPGFDHAGIATQMVVEQQLRQIGDSKETLGRDAFVERVWSWKTSSGQNIEMQMQALGTSADWSRSRFTLDERLSEAVQKVFIDLYEEGLIYRGERLVNWDPVSQTAVSDLEVDMQEEAGSLWHIRYPAVDGRDGVVVATTRPETLLGDVAVAVHPEDKRHKKWIGKKLKLPLCDREIPVIADESIDPTFGTGCVKITPAHDFNDYAMGIRHNLPRINILTKEAKLNEHAPKAYQGLDRFVARERILADLKTQGLLEKTEAHTLNLPRGDRSGEVLEPFLTIQWFVKMDSLAKPAIEAVEQGRIRFVPENWDKTYFEWMRNIQDWCISRQLWWGHRIPAWYDAEGKVYVGKDETDARARNGLAKDLPLKQDEDVLDTWFSSALWPFSTLGWPKQTQELSQFYPSNVLITGFDIIFFWVARMVMMGLKFTGEIPFKEVYIHGLIQDAYGRKMSKSKGNILDPMDLIHGIDLESLLKKRTSGLMQPKLAEQIAKDTRKEYPEGIPAYGTDALRFTFTALASNNRFIRFDLKRIEGYRHFCNKLWNAARFVLMNVDSEESADLGKTLKKTAYQEPAKKLSPIDHWILSRWQETKAEVHRQIAQYRFDQVAQVIYEFTWNEYCDWYLELSKPVLMGNLNDTELTYGARNTLLTILDELLRVLHPIIPFITSEIWEKVAPLVYHGFDPETRLLMTEPYPEVNTALRNTEAEADITLLKQVISAVRQLRRDLSLPNVLLLYQSRDAESRKSLKAIEPWIKEILKVKIRERDPEVDRAIPLTGVLHGNLTFYLKVDEQAIPILHAYHEKLEKEKQKNLDLIALIEQKLLNPRFQNKAPLDVVEKEKGRQKLAKQANKEVEDLLNSLFIDGGIEKGKTKRLRKKDNRLVIKTMQKK